MTNIHPNAPGELELVREFVNTLDIEAGADELSSPEALRRWYADKELTAEGARAPTEIELREAAEVREALRALLVANHDRTVDPQAVATLNRALRRRPYILQVTPPAAGRLRLVEARAGDGLARLMGIVFASMSDGSWARLKICRNQGCRWAFYDYSRNRSGNWCSMAVCGNRTKVRAYQARAKARKEQPPG